MCYLHQKFGVKAWTCYTPLNFQGAGKLLSLQSSATTDASSLIKGHLVHIQDDFTGLKFLIDSSAQMSLLPATNSDRLKGVDKLPLQAVNKYVSKTYAQKQIVLILGLR